MKNGAHYTGAPRPYLRWCSCTTCEGVGAPPSQGVPPPQKKEKEVKRGKKKKGRQKEIKNT